VYTLQQCDIVGLVDVYTPDITGEVDHETYATDLKTGTEVTNQFGFADSGCTYLSRQDWIGTFPTHDGEVSDTVSTWGNEINGSDGVVAGNRNKIQVVKTQEL